MRYDVFPFEDVKGRWHRQILGPIPELFAGSVPLLEPCHSSKSNPPNCAGFSDKDSALADGWKRVEELANSRPLV
jgi:hypothetical protein